MASTIYNIELFYGIYVCTYESPKTYYNYDLHETLYYLKINPVFHSKKYLEHTPFPICSQLLYIYIYIFHIGFHIGI